MASFMSKGFSHKQYAAFRPTYPSELYSTILTYHHSHSNGKQFALDLGTGHGLIARRLANDFTSVMGTDPSAGMISQALKLLRQPNMSNLIFRQGFAEQSKFVLSRSVDLVTAGQAAHWFNYSKLWPELNRITRPGSTLAFWGYKDHILPCYPKASKVIQYFAYNKDPELLGSYWQQPGRSIVQDKLRQVNPPQDEWHDVRRIEYEPGTDGTGSGTGTRFMCAKMTLGAMEEYMRTWSSFHEWQKIFPEKTRRSDKSEEPGDVIDEIMDAIRESEPDLARDEETWKDIEVDVEWGSVLMLASKI